MNASAEKRPVLIVDDSPMYRTAAKGMLQKLGYKGDLLHFAQDAKEAIKQCTTNDYELVFFDYNLGEHANGFQLIDELKTKKLLAEDCVNIIVTGDATPEVVRGFMELEPDGYLLKPLNYTTLKERLPSFIRKKRELAPVLRLLGKNKTKEAIALIDETFYHEEDILVRSQILKAEALIELNQPSEARNVLINLKETCENSKVSLLLARLALKQRQYKQGLFILEPLFKDPFHSAAANRLAAEFSIYNADVAKAVDYIEASIETSPKVIERHWFASYLQLAVFNLEGTLRNLKRMLHEAKFSCHETMSMYLLGAVVTLDCAQFLPKEQQNVFISTIPKWAEAWRGRYSRAVYKPAECLVFARTHIMRGDFLKARQSLAEYRHVVTSLDNHQPCIFEEIELSRVYLLLGYTKESSELAEQINIRLKSDAGNIHSILTLQYLSKWRIKAQTATNEAKKLKAQVEALFAQKSFEKGVTILANGSRYKIYDKDYTRLLYVSLTKAWPSGWSKKDVTHLAIRCKDQLHGTPFEKSRDYVSASKLLAKQLGYADLAANATTKA